MSSGGRRFEYAATVDRAARISVRGGAPVELAEEWTPEHLLLAGLVRCTIASFLYHARRAGLDATASGSASGVVVMRDEDGRYAFAELECRLDALIDPEPPGDELDALIAKAERDCFVGASLRAPPVYRWHVNGVDR